MKLMKFKRVAVTVLIVLAAYLLQCTLFNHLELAGIKPNLILIVTASFGFMRGQKEGMLVGFFAGLITDIQFGTILGFYALLYLVIGFVNGLFEQLYFDEDIRPAVIFDFCQRISLRYHHLFAHVHVAK